MQHLSDDEIEQFLAARLGPPGQQRVVRHLLTGCSLCSRKMAERAPNLLLEEAEEGHRRKLAPRSPRGLAIASALLREELSSSDERKLAQSLEVLRSSRRNDDDPFLREGQALQDIPLIDALLRRTRDLRFRDSKTALWLSYKAMT